MKIPSEIVESVCKKFVDGIAEKNFVPDIICVDYLNICASQKYKGGNLSIIFSHHGGGIKPLLGAYYTSNDENGEWLPASWFESGHYHPGHQTKLDLIIEYEKELA